MGKSLHKDLDRSELEYMREGGMTNQDIANALGVSLSTIYRYIGAQPQGFRRKRNYDLDEQPPVIVKQDEPPKEAALVVEDRAISLAGLFAGYRINVKSKEIIVFVEDGEDALTIPFDQVKTISKEINAICLIIWNNGNPENSIKTVSSGYRTPRKACAFRRFRRLYLIPTQPLDLITS